MPPDLLGSLSALAASFSWGIGDFSGGYASRRHHPFQVLTLSAAIGLLPLLVLILFSNEGFPGFRNLLLGAAAGLAGTLGLAVFYRGLMLGKSAVVAPVASVIGAFVPLIIGMIRSGLPDGQKMVGFAFGLAGIWLVSQQRPVAGEVGETGLRYGLLAGLGFGSFLTLIALVGEEAIYAPLIASKLGGLIFSFIYIRRRGLKIPALTSNPSAALAGLMDTAGNIFYLLGAQLTRLDVVAALSSLYPAGPVLLGRFLLKEQVSGRQWIGVFTSIVAIVLLTL